MEMVRKNVEERERFMTRPVRPPKELWAIVSPYGWPYGFQRTLEDAQEYATTMPGAIPRDGWCTFHRYVLAPPKKPAKKSRGGK